uniref:Beta/gamma crystallin 'Greek key' domain-containing protein n=1 Tax=Leptobrachium leishanense TaxID=445787 RepID=A0A8C5P6H6_9ANUR
MSKLELFAEVDMKGESVSVSADTPDLTSVGFLRHAKSLRVYGEDPWIVFSDINYRGDFRAYKEGEYNSIPGFENMISSVRVVRGGLYDPEITVYEHIYYGGKSLNLKKNAQDLSTHGMNDMISSHIVHRGAWLLYEDKNYQE